MASRPAEPSIWCGSRVREPVIRQLSPRAWKTTALPPSRVPDSTAPLREQNRRTVGTSAQTDTSEGRWRRVWHRIVGGWGVPTYELQGVEQLGGHVLERLSGLESHAGRDVYHDWVASEFTYPLRALLWGSARNRRAHMLLNLLVVAGGFATSGIAVAAGSGHRGSTTSWIVFGIGLTLAVLGGANQLFRPGYRATERTSVAVELREEGWAFAMALGVYAGELTVAFDTFQERVSVLQRRIAKFGELESQGQGSGRSSARSRR